MRISDWSSDVCSSDLRCCWPAGRTAGRTRAERMQLVDSHSHIDADEFDADRAAVVERARAAGVARQVVPAVDAISWPKLRDVCAAIEGLFPAYGLPPTFLPGPAPQHPGPLRE